MESRPHPRVLRPDPVVQDMKTELSCPAGSLPALKAAVDHGADVAYLGFENGTNARNLAGLNFDAKTIGERINYALSWRRKV